MTSTINYIEVRNLDKKYRGKKVIDNYSHVFTKGKCIMIMGENGSGKSTLLKIILGLVHKTSGVINNPFKSISYVPEKINLPMNVKVIDFLNVLRDIKNCNKDKIDYLLDYFEITFAKEYKLRELSKGMMQKVLIIQALMADSCVYVFDEVLNGLDKKMQDKFLKYIDVLKGSGALILITSHYSSIYQDVIDEVVIMGKKT